MRTIRFMNHTGDREVHVDLLSPRERTRVEEDFNDALRYGCRAFKVDRENGKPDEMVFKFEDLENHTIVITPVAAG